MYCYFVFRKKMFSSVIFFDCFNVCKCKVKRRLKYLRILIDLSNVSNNFFID